MASTLIRRSPLLDLAELRGWLERPFEDVFNGERYGWAPAIDVIKEEGRLLVRADVPGVKPEDIKIEVEDDVLTLSGEHEEKKEEKDKHFVRKERRYGSFSRSISLPPNVVADDVEAICKDGVLEVSVPLPQPQQKKAVEIKPKRAES